MPNKRTSSDVASSGSSASSPGVPKEQNKAKKSKKTKKATNRHPTDRQQEEKSPWHNSIGVEMEDVQLCDLGDGHMFYKVLLGQAEKDLRRFIEWLMVSTALILFIWVQWRNWHNWHVRLPAFFRGQAIIIIAVEHGGERILIFACRGWGGGGAC